MSTAQAQTSVVVTGSREPVSLDRLAADIVVIDRALIESSTADSMADLLRREAGVQLSRSGGPGQNTGLLLRGAASVNTLVLVDGVRVGSATLGYAQIEALSLSNVERIEVLRGPGSSLYGADAVGGVVQIFTRAGAGAPKLAAHVGLGGYASREGAVALSGSSGPWAYAVSASQEQSQGVSALRAGDAFGNHNPDADGHQLRALQARLGWSPVAGQRIGFSLLRTRLNAQFDGSEFLPPSYAQDASPDFRNRMNTALTALDWRSEIGAGMTATARWSQGRETLLSGATAPDRYTTTRDQGSIQLTGTRAPWGGWTVALESLQEDANSTAYVAPVKRNNLAGVLALSGQVQAWAWHADVRRDDSSDYGGVTTARLGASWALSPAWRLRAMSGSTYRAPSFNELHFPGYGVASLQPERGRSAELGLNWRSGAQEAAFTVFRNDLRSLIAYESDASLCPADPAYSFGCARNISRARLQGATLSGAHQEGAWGFKGQLDLLDATDRDSGQRLSRRAAHQASASVDWQQGPWAYRASMLRVGARPDGGVQLAAETTLDLQATWRFAPRWRLVAKLLNATDEDLQPARDYQGLGRQAWLLLRYEGALLP